MYTGIVEVGGTIVDVSPTPTGRRVTISANPLSSGDAADDRFLAGVALGDSIAVNGVCLTAVEISDDRFAADVIPETIERTTLGGLAAGTAVNLERPMRADSRFDGHMVQGHVDGTGTVDSVTQTDDGGVRMRIDAAPELMAYIVEKGSITIDGVSLTVATEDGVGFEVALIPHTLSVTNLDERVMGDLVNLEVDLIAKYVARYADRFAQKDQP